MGAWKNPGKLLCALLVFPLVFVATIFALGEIVSEKWIDALELINGVRK